MKLLRKILGGFIIASPILIMLYPPFQRWVRETGLSFFDTTFGEWAVTAFVILILLAVVISSTLGVVIGGYTSENRE